MYGMTGDELQMIRHPLFTTRHMDVSVPVETNPAGNRRDAQAVRRGSQAAMGRSPRTETRFLDIDREIGIETSTYGGHVDTGVSIRRGLDVHVAAYG